MENGAIEGQWFFEHDNDAIIGIETRKYSNGDVIKRCRLSNGAEAVSREISGADLIETDKVAGGKQENAFPAMMAMSTKIDGISVTMEDLLVLKAKDFNKIRAMVAQLNF